MAMIETAHKAPFGAISTFRATTVISNMVETVTTAIHEWVETRRTADALARLSPAMLEDIGLTQADVNSYRMRAGDL